MFDIKTIVDRYFQHAGQRSLVFDDIETGCDHPIPAQKDDILLYLHIPFCVALCPFCSFHRVEFKANRARSYFSALRREIRLAEATGYRFSELYVGGGTPTVMPDELAKTIELVRELNPISGVSVETNPDDLSEDITSQLVSAGVNRLSVGVQSFDDQLLKEMQRYDKYGSGEKIRNRLKAVQGTFDTLNVDMIFNFPHQSEASLCNDLHILTGELAVDQVSFYPLMTTTSTRKSMLRNLGSVEHSREKHLYERIVDHMMAAGYRRSSAWCFSRDAVMIDEYITEHDEYLGLGSGAFSYLGGRLFASTFSINHYMNLVEGGRSGIVRQLRLTRTDQMRYYLLMRLFSGSLDLDAAESTFNGEFRSGVRMELAALRMFGAVQRDGPTIRLTERGFYLWVVLMRNFFEGVNQLREQMRHNISRETRDIGAELVRT